MSEIKRASNSRAFLRPSVVALSITDISMRLKKTKKTPPECSGVLLGELFQGRLPFFGGACGRFDPGSLKNSFRPGALHAAVAEGKQLIGSFVTLACPRLTDMSWEPSPNQATSSVQEDVLGHDHGRSSEQPKGSEMRSVDVAPRHV